LVNIKEVELSTLLSIRCTCFSSGEVYLLDVFASTHGTQ